MKLYKIVGGRDSTFIYKKKIEAIKTVEEYREDQGTRVPGCVTSKALT
jgi:hypothetical protein